jgi:DNA repair exonuclease SbcCD ATPase subunit
MKAEDKRKIIDRIIGLTIVNKMRELLKSEIKDAKRADEQLKHKTSAIEDEIERITYKLEALNEKIDEENSDRIVELKKVIKKQTTAQEKMVTKEDEISEILSDRMSGLKKLEQNEYGIDKVIRSLKEKIRLYNQDKCPTCGSDFHTPEFSNLKAELESDINDNKSKLEEIEIEKVEWESEIEKVKKLQSKARDKRQKISYEISTLKTELRTLEAGQSQNSQISTVEELKVAAETKLVDVKEQMQKSEHELTFYEMADQLLSENGIKKLAMKKILPVINQQLNSLIQRLGIVYTMKFDDNFDCQISHLGEEIAVSTLSTGEAKKLDSAVLIAIMRLIKIKFPELNILFLDEIFSSLDMHSIRSMIEIVQELSRDLNMHVFVVNHSPLESALFDSIYLISKNNGFSDMCIEEREG